MQIHYFQRYCTKENEGTNVEQAMLPATSDEFKISNVDANKNRINGTDTVVINAIPLG